MHIRYLNYDYVWNIKQNISTLTWLYGLYNSAVFVFTGPIGIKEFTRYKFILCSAGNFKTNFGTRLFTIFYSF